MSEQHKRRIVISPGQEVVIRAAGDPTGDPLTAVFDAIVAEGHVRIGLSRHADGWWYCHTSLPEEEDPNELGQSTGPTAITAASVRRDEVRKLTAKRKDAP